MFEWLWNALIGFALGAIPLWVWVIVAGLAIGWAWRTFGWQGIVGAGIAILTLGAYRQGWRDRGEGKQPIVPPAGHAQAPKPRPVRRPHPTLAEGLRKLFGRK